VLPARVFTLPMGFLLGLALCLPLANLIIAERVRALGDIQVVDAVLDTPMGQLK